MKKKSSFLALLLVLAMAVASFAAPTAADLVTDILPETEEGTMIVGVRDVKALSDEMASGTLLGRVCKMGMGLSELYSVPIVTDLAGAFAGDIDKEELKTFAFAMTLTGDLEGDNLNKLKEDFKIADPDFTVAEPLTALGQVVLDNKHLLKVAKLSRDGAFYVVGTTADPAELAKFVASTAVADVKTPDNLYAVIKVEKTFIAENVVPVSYPFEAEIGISSTAGAVKARLWTNMFEMLSSAVEADLSPLLEGTDNAGKPLILGSGPLMGLINLSLACLPPDLKPADLPMGEELWAMVSDKVAAVGLDWADVLAILRGNITIGLAGKTNAIGDEFPGLYVNASGAPVAKIAPFAGLLKFMRNGVADYNANGFVGVSVTDPAPVVVAVGDKGVLAAAMNHDELVQTPTVADGIVAALEPRAIAIAFDTKALQTVLEKVFEKYGNTALGAVGQDDPVTKGIVSAVIENMGMLDAIAIYSEGTDLLTIEVTPDVNMVNMFLSCF